MFGKRREQAQYIGKPLPEIVPMRNPDGSVNLVYFKRDEELRQRLIEKFNQPPGEDIPIEKSRQLFREMRKSRK